MQFLHCALWNCNAQYRSGKGNPNTVQMCGKPRLRQQGEYYASTEISLNTPLLGHPFQRTKIPLLIIPHHYNDNWITPNARCNVRNCPFHRPFSLLVCHRTLCASESFLTPARDWINRRWVWWEKHRVASHRTGWVVVVLFYNDE